MANEQTIKTRTTDHFTLQIESEDGREPRIWKLCYDYRAIAKIEEAIGKDIKRIADWVNLSSGKDFPTIVWGGLNRYNPEVSLDQVIDILNPDAQRLLSDKIFDMMFPQVREAFEKLQKEKEAGATASPNAGAGTTSI
jgi:hypothetical protein